MTDQNSNKYTYFIPDIEDENDESGASEVANLAESEKSFQNKKRGLEVITDKIHNHIWLNISEAAKLGGVQPKTLRRAIKEKKDLRYKIVQNKYKVELRSLIIYLHSSTKLRNKLYQYGLGQYVTKWRKK